MAVFERAGEQVPWRRVATIVPPEGVDLVRASSQVDAALDGDRIVVRGMVPDDTPDPSDGPVRLFVYERDPSSGSWEHTTQIAGVGTVAGVPQLSGDRLAMISREPTCPGLCADDHAEVFEHDPVTGTWNRTLDRPAFDATLDSV